jgi:predicted transcriptional regulator
LKRNVPRGLANRTKVILALEREPSNAKELSEKTGMSYASVLHHLHLLENERIVARRGGRPYMWELTGAGQQSLIEVWLHSASSTEEG